MEPIQKLKARRLAIKRKSSFFKQRCSFRHKIDFNNAVPGSATPSNVSESIGPDPRRADFES